MQSVWSLGVCLRSEQFGVSTVLHHDVPNRSAQPPCEERAGNSNWVHSADRAGSIGVKSKLKQKQIPTESQSMKRRLVQFQTAAGQSSIVAESSREEPAKGIRHFHLPMVPLFLMTFASFANAQTSQATIRGTVHDSSNAVIVGASVTLTNVDTRVSAKPQQTRMAITSFSISILAPTPWRPPARALRHRN